MIEVFKLSNQTAKSIPLPKKHGLDFPQGLDARPANQSLYRSILGKLQFAAQTARPDIAYATGKLAQYASDPRAIHMDRAYHVLSYLKGTKDLAIVYHKNVPGASPRLLRGWSDADWANDPDRKSISGFAFSHGPSTFSWKSAKQKLTATSTTEAELIAAFSATCEAVYFRDLLEELGESQPTTVIMEDNKGVLDLMKDSKHHERTKHIDTKYMRTRDHVKAGDTRLEAVTSADNVADIFTKALAKPQFLYLRNLLVFSAMSNHGNTTGVNEGPSSFESASTGSSVAHSTSETHSKNNASSYETFADLPVHRQIDLADRSGFTVRQLTIANIPVFLPHPKRFYYLDQVEFAYNSAPQSTIKTSPFVADLGFLPRQPAMIRPPSDARTPSNVESLQVKLKAILLRTQEYMSFSQLSQQRQADKHRRPVEIKVGDSVLIHHTSFQSPSNRMLPLFVGPYTAVKAIGGGNAFELDLPTTVKNNRVFNVSKLRKYVKSDEYPAEIRPTEDYVKKNLNRIASVAAMQNGLVYLQFTDSLPGHCVAISTSFWNTMPAEKRIPLFKAYMVRIKARDEPL
ncbi:uncharacterized protein SAPINGB_P005399 [Magnusiomyces paraingens]|uniref:Tf2-1-like SH3-like domain-containing protein n=1 Tax=Magnusiomyces paraingens TaxID=2606893 RepID=A0A5E8C0L0_9ASCO|nr:uncharacterized protein SAPINGB_P005399 [Saprochaete ingens]VVT56912.1 unnamed protein product [Saprochaete ingens]